MDFVTQALAADRRPSRTASDKVILRAAEGRGFRTLVSPGGVLTAAGRAYETQSGERLPKEGLDAAQSTQREGNVETILVRGARRVVRTF